MEDRSKSSTSSDQPQSDWEKEIVAALKSFTPEERKVYKHILGIIERQDPIYNRKVLSGLKGRRATIEKILSLEGINRLLTPLGQFFMLNIDAVERAKDQLCFIEQSGKVENYLDALEAQLNRGNIVGLRELVYWAHDATKRLEELANKYPEYVSIVAREYATWPILAAANKPKLLKKIEMLELIQLNKARPNVTQATKVAINPTPPQKWAVRLLRTVEAARQWHSMKDNASVTLASEHEIESQESIISVIKFDENILLPSNEVFDLAESMVDLSEFSHKSVQAWWEIAHKIFLQVTKYEPWKVPELKSYANSTKFDPNAKNKKFDGVRRDSVVKAVKKAFFDLASSTK